jgi:serine/threonine protein kinase
MGIVYKARDPIINRLVALKTITASVAESPELLERFYREAQSAGSLQHPNVITIYEMGEEGGVPFIAMQLVDGPNLGVLIARRAPIPLSLKLVYAVEACRAFAYAHKQGIIHRDIKPSNVMVTKDGTVKVVDFGIARVLQNSKTQTGMLFGTFAYMSPEVFNGEHADERSDIFSFGVLLYELVAYTRPFPGDMPASLMQSICLKEPIPLRSVAPDCPPELEAVVNRTLLKPVNERTQSMEDLLLELDPICKGLQAQAVVDLVSEARALVQKRDFAPARELLVQALQVDFASSPARTLLEEVNTELKRILIRPKVEKHVATGRDLLDQGKLQEAQLEAESALKLDSNFEPADELLRQVQHEIGRAKLVREWLQASRERLAAGSPEEAESFLEKIREVDPANREVTKLQEQVVEEKEKRQKRIHLLETMQQARTLWMQQKYDECIDLLTSLQDEFGRQEEVQKLLETAREDRAEQLKRRTLERARTLLAAGGFDECKSLLTNLHGQFPNDDEIPNLLEQVRKDEAEHQKLEGLNEARNLLASRHYGECLQLLESLKLKFTGEPEIERLVNAVHEDQEAEQREQGLKEAQSLMVSQRYNECRALLDRLQARFPADREIPKLLEELREEEAEQRRLDGLSEAQKLLASKQYAESLALLGELRKQFPDDKQIPALTEAAQKEQAEQRKLEGLSEVQKLASAKRYDESLALLSRLKTEYPDDKQIPALTETVQKEQAEERRLAGISDAQKLLASKRYSECLIQLHNLQTQYPQDKQISALAETVLKEQAEHRRLEGIAAAQKLLASERYGECLALLRDLHTQFPDDKQIPALAQTVQKEQAEQRRLEGLSDARKFLASKQYVESLALLNELKSEFPGDKQISELEESVQKEQAEQRKLEGLSEARKLLAAKQYAESLALLNDLKTQFPADNQIPALIETVRTQQAEHQKSQALLEAQRLLASKQYGECLSLLDGLRKQFPDDRQISGLAEAARKDQAEQQRLQGLADARKLRASRQYPESLALLSELKSRFPDDKEILKLREAIEKDQAEQQKAQGLSEARALLASRHLAESLALLNDLKIQFPSDKEILKLSEAVQRDQAEQQKQQALANARKLRGSKQYAESLALLNELSARFPADREILRLIEGVTRDQAEQQKLQGLSEARNRLAAGRVDESLTLLSELRKQFPREDDITRLLATVEQEKAEQEKQKRFAEARALLGSQRFTEALEILDPLLKANPKDQGVLKLRALILDEREKFARAAKLARELQDLKKLIAEESYEAAVSKAESLLPEFADDVDLVRLLDFARNRKEQIDREQRLSQILSEVQKFMASNQLAEAIASARRGLESFEGNSELSRLLDQAESQRKKEFTRLQIQQRVREIKIKIHREEFSDAVRMAEDALTTLGPDTDLTQLLSSAQVETQSRDKKRDQARKLERVRALLDLGDLEGATLVLGNTIKEEGLDTVDPRVDRLSKEIAAAARAKDPTKAPTADELPAKEYALHEGPPQIAPPEQQNPVEATPAPVNSASQTASSVPQSEIVPQEQVAPEPAPPEVVIAPVAAPASIRPAPQHVQVPPQPVPARMRPVALILGLLGLILAGATAEYFMHRPKPSQEAGQNVPHVAPAPSPASLAESQQRDAMDAADKLIASGDLKGALQVLQAAEQLNGSHTAEIKSKEASITESIGNEKLANLRRQETALWQQATGEITRAEFDAAERDMGRILALGEGGVRKADAQKYLSEVIPQRQREESLFKQASQLRQSNDLQGLQRAEELFGQVVALGGPRKAEAADLQREVDAKLNALKETARNQQLNGLEAAARQNIGQGDLSGARQKADQIRQMGGDPAALLRDIDQAQANQTLRVQQQSEFQQAVQTYKTVGNTDKTGLEKSLGAFQSIVRGNGPYAGDSQPYISEINKKIESLNAPPPPPAKAAVVDTTAADESAVRLVIQRFFDAFSQKNADNLRQVWPGIPPSKYEGYKKSFEEASAIGMKVDSESVKVDGAAATASAQSQYQYTLKGQNALKPVPQSWSFQLTKRNGVWLITEVR